MALYACKWCGTETDMDATRMCNGCWELDSRISMNPRLAIKILQSFIMKAPMEPIDRAAQIAMSAHAGQKDKVFQPYVLHLMRVASRAVVEDEIVVAILHDIIEDTDWTQEQLQNIFGSKIAEAVAVLSREKGEDYEKYIERVAFHPLAKRVKILDLQDHLTEAALGQLPEDALSLVARYVKAYQYLKNN